MAYRRGLGVRTPPKKCWYFNHTECVKIQYFQPKILKKILGGAPLPHGRGSGEGDTPFPHPPPSAPTEPRPLHAEILGTPLGTTTRSPETVSWCPASDLEKTWTGVSWGGDEMRSMILLMSSSGRSLHVCGPATGKARLPTVDSLLVQCRHYQAIGADRTQQSMTSNSTILQEMSSCLLLYIVYFFRNLVVKELCTSVYICQSYDETTSVLFFSDSQCIGYTVRSVVFHIQEPFEGTLLQIRLSTSYLRTSSSLFISWVSKSK